jgi:hypothetical protein
MSAPGASGPPLPILIAVSIVGQFTGGRIHRNT